MCPSTTIYVSSCTNCRRQYCKRARAVDEELDRFTSGTTILLKHVCPHTTAVYVTSYYCCMCVLILLLYMCPHTTAVYVSSYYCYICVLILLLYVSSYYCCICVLILLLYMCPHTTAVYVSSYYCCICVLTLLLHISPHTTAMYVSRHTTEERTFSPQEEAAIVRAKIRQTFFKKISCKQTHFFIFHLRRRPP
jgi:hypothetical protein